MATAAQQWKALCDEFTAARAEEVRLLGLTVQAGGDPDLEVAEQFDEAYERTAEIKARMDAWLDAHTH